MKYDQALAIAKQIQKRNPDYILCGSVALILAKIIPEREVSDVDFLSNKDEFKAESLQMTNYPIGDNDGYKTYKITQPNTYYYYNVFVHDKPQTLTQVIDGITIQHVDEILKYKKQYGRVKDLDDLGKIK